MPVNCFVIKKNDILTLASLYSNTNKKKRKGENKLVYTFYELCWFFLIYSFAGWCAGVVANAVRNRKFVNTGFMNMPFCLSYGVCTVLYFPAGTAASDFFLVYRRSTSGSVRVHYDRADPGAYFSSEMVGLQ